MDCFHYQEQILQSLERGLPANEKAVVDAHLATCSACREFSQVQALVEDALSAELKAPDLSPAFRARLRGSIRWDSRPAWRHLVPDLSYVIGCLAMAAFGIWRLPQLRTLIPELSASQILYASLLLAVTIAALGSLFTLQAEESES